MTLSRKKNPFFEHAEAEYFLAERNGAVVGRIAAIENRLHNETHGDRVGFFGFFECIDDQDVAERALRDRGGVAARAQARRAARAGVVLHQRRVRPAGRRLRARRPTLMMPHNPPYYVTLMERAGFTKAKDLLVYQGGDAEEYVPVPERLARGTELIRQRQGITLRPLNMKDFAAEVERIKEIYNAAWEKNWGFVPMTDTRSTTWRSRSSRW